VAGGYQAKVTVTNGSAPATSWTVSLTFPGSQTIASSWNATVSQSGANVTAVNASYNGALPAGGTAAWGMVVNGQNQPPSALTCAAS
jgi:cellulase/cellobiase CelA1